MKSKRCYILFFIDTLITGGIQEQLYLRLKYLDKERYYLKVVSLSSSSFPQPYAEKIEKLGVEVDFLSLSSENFLSSQMKKITHYLRIEKPDLVHNLSFRYLNSVIMGTSLTSGSLLITDLHSLPPNTQGKTISFIEKYALSNFPLLILPCAFRVYEEYQKYVGIDPKKMRTFSNAIEISLKQPDKAKVETIKQNWGIKEGDFVLGSVGRLSAEKNYACLIKAFAMLQKKYPASWLIIVGDGYQKAELVKLAEELKVNSRCIFAGETREVNLFWAIFDIFVLSSNWEALPVTILEAMANGLPVIATQVGGIKEAVVDKETGFLIPPEKPAILAEKISYLMENPQSKREMGEKGRQKAQQDFDIKKRVMELENIYGQLLTNKLETTAPLRILIWRLCPWDKLIEVVNSLQKRFGEIEIYFISQKDTREKLGKLFSIPSASIIEYGEGQFKIFKGVRQLRLKKLEIDLVVIPYNNARGKGYEQVKWFLRLFSPAPVLNYLAVSGKKVRLFQPPNLISRLWGFWLEGFDRVLIKFYFVLSWLKNKGKQ